MTVRSRLGGRRLWGCLAVLGTSAAVARSGTVPPPAHRWSGWALAASVGAARVYVGAHLPLDVLGGGALGTVAATGWRARCRGPA